MGYQAILGFKTILQRRVFFLEVLVVDLHLVEKVLESLHVSSATASVASSSTNFHSLDRLEFLNLVLELALDVKGRLA